MRSWFFATAIGLAVAAPTFAQGTKSDDFFFKKGDVVLIDGDSITEQRLYSNYIEMWSVTRFPEYKLVFRNVGVSGDVSPGGNRRLKTELPLLKPTAMTVDFGMNDGRYTKFEPKNFEPYMKGLQGMADQAKAAGVRVAWVTPQPEEFGQPGKQLVGYNLTLEKFGEGVSEIAKKNDGLFVDQFHPYLAVIEKARETDAKIRITGGDSVHPGPGGQSLMAASILKGLHFPKDVSSVSIDASGKGDAIVKNCTVAKVDFKDGVRFERHDKALPFFPEKAKSILKWTPLLEEMNHYGLQVKGLPAGKYEVRLGGKKAATYSADDLAKGVNLASAALAVGPVADQAKEVAKAVDEKTAYFHDQIFRGIMEGGGPRQPGQKKLAKDATDDQKKTAAEEREAALKVWREKRKEWDEKKPALLAERLAKTAELDAVIHAASQPKAYLVEIVASKGASESK
jgi:lysophospholipase L1-like esterase